MSYKSQLLARISLLLGATPLLPGCSRDADPAELQARSEGAAGTSANAGGASNPAGAAGSPGAGGVAAQAGNTGDPGETCTRSLPENKGSTPFCHTQDDCPEPGAGLGVVCTAQQFSGTCFQPPLCEGDADCKPLAPKKICHKHAGGETGTCDRACTEMPEVCGDGFVCDAGSGHCQPGTPPPCQDTSDCPEHQQCKKGTCKPQACTCDTECAGGGYCVRKQCSTTPGFCEIYGICGRPLLVGQSPVLASLLLKKGWS